MMFLRLEDVIVKNCDAKLTIYSDIHALKIVNFNQKPSEIGPNSLLYRIKFVILHFRMDLYLINKKTLNPKNRYGTTRRCV